MRAMRIRPVGGGIADVSASAALRPWGRPPVGVTAAYSRRSTRTSARVAPGDHEPGLVGDDDELRTVAQPQLAQDAAHVCLRRERADDELGRYLRVRHP